MSGLNNHAGPKPKTIMMPTNNPMTLNNENTMFTVDFFQVPEANG